MLSSSTFAGLYFIVAIFVNILSAVPFVAVTLQTISNESVSNVVPSYGSNLNKYVPVIGKILIVLVVASYVYAYFFPANSVSV